MHELASVNVDWVHRVHNWLCAGGCSLEPKLTAITIQRSDSKTAFAQCFFYLPRWMPPLLPRKNICSDSQTIHFLQTSSLPFVAEVSCSGPITRHLLSITDRFFCFILVFICIINIWHSCKYFNFSIVCTEKQLNKQLELPHHIKLFESSWDSFLSKQIHLFLSCASSILLY